MSIIFEDCWVIELEEPELGKGPTIFLGQGRWDRGAPAEIITNYARRFYDPRAAQATLNRLKKKGGWPNAVVIKLCLTAEKSTEKPKSKRARRCQTTPTLGLLPKKYT